MKNGFVTYSEGDAEARVLTYRKITNSELGPAQTICEKGSAGGDIQGVISFDGKWIAFARKNCPYCPKQDGQWNGNGEDDYHKFHCWGIYVARLDGPMPAIPIKIADEGYFPSWGDDSFGSTKTLYYGIWTKGEIWKATVHDEGSKVSAIMKHASVPGWKALDHHMQCSPNGKILVFSTGVKFKITTVGLNGHNHYQDIGAGCHPSWFADSHWFFHGRGTIVNINGQKAGGSEGGPYHFGSSSNMKWAITITNFVINNQHLGYRVQFAKIKKTDTTLIIGDFNSPIVTEKGTWPDIHEFETIPVTG